MLGKRTFFNFQLINCHCQCALPPGQTLWIFANTAHHGPGRSPQTCRIDCSGAKANPRKPKPATAHPSPSSPSKHPSPSKPTKALQSPPSHLRCRLKFCSFPIRLHPHRGLLSEQCFVQHCTKPPTLMRLLVQCESPAANHTQQWLKKRQPIIPKSPTIAHFGAW